MKVYKMFIFILILLVFNLGLLRASIQLQPNIFNKWNVYMTGNESVLYDISSLTDNLICIKAKDTSLKDITVKEQDETKPIKDSKTNEILNYNTKDVVYKYPKDITLYTGLEKTAETTKLVTDKDICFTLEPKAEKLFKIGEQSITILGNGVYNSTDTNVTQENLYTHLNLSDGSLVLYMPFDVMEDSTNITYDYSENSNNGILYGGTSIVQPVFNLTGGEYGGGYEFDGIDDYIDFGDVNETEGIEEITISFWFKTNGTKDLQGLVTKSGYFVSGNSWGVSVDGTTGRLKFSIANTVYAYANIPSIKHDRWYQITVTYSNNDDTMKLYSDNVLIKDGKTGGTYVTIPNTDKNLYIGKDVNAGGDYFEGSIDEVMIFNRSLSVKEVGQIYNATYPRFYPNGEQRFIDNNFGTNNTVNITIPNCQQLNGSSIYFDINGNGFSQLNSTCMYDGYNLTGDTTNATLTLKLNSGTYSFYSPLVVGNITLDDYYVTYCTNNIVNQTIQDWYDITICFYDWKTQNKTIVEYDSNFCGDYGNVTYYLQQNTSCTNYWINYNPINGTRNCFAYNSEGRFAYNYLPNKITGDCTR